MTRLPLIAFILAVAIVSILVIGPFTDVPVVDDYFHKRVVDESIAAGGYTPHTFIGSTLVLQVGWGVLFTLLFGEGYIPLRFSTLILGVAGAWVVARTSMDLGASRMLAATAAICVWANPIYLLLAHSYMTDVPFFLFVSLAMWMQVRGMLRESPGWIAGGIAMGFAAFFIRQHGLAAVMASWTVAVYLLVVDRRALPRSIWISMFIATAAGMVLVALWSWAYPFTESQSSWIGEGEGWPLSARIPQTVWYLGIGLAYLGLFSAPLVLARGFAAQSVKAWVGWGVAFGVLAVVSVLLTRGMTRMPYLPDYLYDFGVGQLTFTGTSMLNRVWKPATVGALWWGPTLVALGGAAVLLRDGVALLFVRGDDEEESRKRGARLYLYVLVAAFVVGYAPFLPRAFSDRYLLTALAPAIVLIAASGTAIPRRVVYGAVVGALALTVVSTGMVRDYFAMTNARWAATVWLLENHEADPLRVDGGYEYNGVYTMDHFVEETGAVSFTQIGDHGYWLTEPPAYAIDLLPRDEWEVIHRESYTQWLPPQSLEILVMKANAED